MAVVFFCVHLRALSVIDVYAHTTTSLLSRVQCVVGTVDSAAFQLHSCVWDIFVELVSNLESQIVTDGVSDCEQYSVLL